MVNTVVGNAGKCSYTSIIFCFITSANILSTMMRFGFWISAT